MVYNRFSWLLLWIIVAVAVRLPRQTWAKEETRQNESLLKTSWFYSLRSMFGWKSKDSPRAETPHGWLDTIKLSRKTEEQTFQIRWLDSIRNSFGWTKEELSPVTSKAEPAYSKSSSKIVQELKKALSETRFYLETILHKFKAQLGEWSKSPQSKSSKSSLVAYLTSCENTYLCEYIQACRIVFQTLWSSYEYFVDISQKAFEIKVLGLSVLKVFIVAYVFYMLLDGRGYWRSLRKTILSNAVALFLMVKAYWEPGFQKKSHPLYPLIRSASRRGQWEPEPGDWCRTLMLTESQAEIMIKERMKQISKVLRNHRECDRDLEGLREVVEEELEEGRDEKVAMARHLKRLESSLDRIRRVLDPSPGPAARERYKKWEEHTGEVLGQVCHEMRQIVFGTWDRREAMRRRDDDDADRTRELTSEAPSPLVGERSKRVSAETPTEGPGETKI